MLLPKVIRIYGTVVAEVVAIMALVTVFNYGNCSQFLSFFVYCLTALSLCTEIDSYPSMSSAACCCCCTWMLFVLCIQICEARVPVILVETKLSHCVHSSLTVSRMIIVLFLSAVMSAAFGLDYCQLVSLTQNSLLLVTVVSVES